jgi:hypothetical protein
MPSSDTIDEHDTVGALGLESLETQFTDPEVETPVRVLIDITHARTHGGANALQLTGYAGSNLNADQALRLSLDVSLGAQVLRDIRLDAGFNLQ